MYRSSATAGRARAAMTAERSAPTAAGMNSASRGEIAKYASQSLGCELMNYGGELYLTDRIKAINAADL